MDRPIQGDPVDLAEQQQVAILNENPEAAAPDPLNVDETAINDPSQLTDEHKKALMELVDGYEREDEELRKAKLREWKLYEHFWHDNQHNVWSEIAQDWRPIESYDEEDDLDLEGFDPKTVNIYKAHGESVIAAMSSGIPGVKFFPDDADSSDDVSTSKVYSRAAELIQRRNKAALLLIRSIYILWNQGVVAFYNYARTDPKLGTVVQPIKGLVEQPVDVTYCPQCGMDFQGGTCPTCGYEGNPEQDQEIQQVPGIVGHKTITRITEDIQAYSPLYFRIPHRVTSQEECAYLTLDTEQRPGVLIATFAEEVPNIRELVHPSRDEERYDRWARNLSDSKWYGESSLVTVRQRWVRSWALEEIEDERIREDLKRLFPDGVYFVQAGDNFIVARNENMDDHWTISTSPTSPHLMATPLGKSLVPVQEMTNELAHMTVDNIRHGTPMTFADKELINLESFKQSRVVPGAIYPVSISPGQSISNYLHETKPSTLSEEVRYFSGELKEFGQFVSGAFPSIYGGAISSGSGTAKEYEMSRNQALQRLQITWRITSETWTEMISKATKDYLDNLKYDERFVKEHGKYGYINVWIRKSEMTGKVGEVIAESSESFPINNSQKRDMLLKFLEMKDPTIASVMFHPENSGEVASLLGFGDYYIPGEDNRSKQLNEIMLLLTSGPMPGMNGEMMPSIMPDMDIDEHEIHIETIKAFLVSETGLLVKQENPMGYQNCIAHLKAHEMGAMIQMMKSGAMNPGLGEGENPNPDDHSVEAPKGVESGQA